jgi:hypothetical protein
LSLLGIQRAFEEDVCHVFGMGGAVEAGSCSAVMECRGVGGIDGEGGGAKSHAVSTAREGAQARRGREGRGRFEGGDRVVVPYGV